MLGKGARATKIGRREFMSTPAYHIVDYYCTVCFEVLRATCMNSAVPLFGNIASGCTFFVGDYEYPFVNCQSYHRLLFTVCFEVLRAVNITVPLLGNIAMGCVPFFGDYEYPFFSNDHRLVDHASICSEV